MPTNFSNVTILAVKMMSLEYSSWRNSLLLYVESQFKLFINHTWYQKNDVKNFLFKPR